MTEAAKPISKRPKSGKGSAILTRVTMAMRQSIEAEAEATGQSISQIVERRLTDETRLSAAGSAAPGVSDVISAMIRVVPHVTNEVADPTSTQIGRTALIACWVHIIENAFPFTPRGATEIELDLKARNASDHLWQLMHAADCGEIVDENAPLNSTAPPDERLLFLTYNAPNVIGARLRSGDPAPSVRLERLLVHVAHAPERRSLEAIDALHAGLAAMQQAGGTLAAETSAAILALGEFRAALTHYRTEHAEAELRGQKLAAAFGGGVRK